MLLTQNGKNLMKMYNDRYELVKATVIKVMRPVFPPKPFIILSDETERVAYFENLYQQMGEIENVALRKLDIFSYPEGTPKRCHFDFYVETKYKELESVGFHIGVENDSKLCLDCRTDFKTKYAFDSIEDIKRLVEAFVNEYDEAEKRRLKNESNSVKQSKLKKIKHAAILAKIDDIAKEEGFEYIVDSKHTNYVLLSIRLTERDFLDIQIRYKSFQEVLLQIQKAWRAIKDLYEGGVPIKIKNSTYADKWKWKQHQKEEK